MHTRFRRDEEDDDDVAALPGAICAVFFVNLSFFLLWIDLLYAMVFGTKSGSKRQGESPVHSAGATANGSRDKKTK